MNSVIAQQTKVVTNVTNLIKSDVSNANVELENKTVNYFDKAKGYLVYPIISNESKNENSNDTFPAVIMIHENKRTK